MLDQLPRVRDEILKAIGNLKGGQEFAVVSIADGHLQSLSQSTLPNTPRNLARAQRFLNGLATRGEGGQLGELVRAACAFDPQTVWLITCNVADDGDAEVERVLGARASATFHINTLFWPLEISESNPGILASIASRTGGVCVDAEGNVLSATAPESKPSSALPHGPSALDEK